MDIKKLAVVLLAAFSSSSLADGRMDPALVKMLGSYWSDRATVIENASSVTVKMRGTPFRISEIGCMFVAEYVAYTKIGQNRKKLGEWSRPYISNDASAAQSESCPTEGDSYSVLGISVKDFSVVRAIVTQWNAGELDKRYNLKIVDRPPVLPMLPLRIRSTSYFRDSAAPNRHVIESTLRDARGDMYVMHLRSPCKKSCEIELARQTLTQ